MTRHVQVWQLSRMGKPTPIAGRAFVGFCRCRPRRHLESCLGQGWPSELPRCARELDDSGSCGTLGQSHNC